MRALYTITVLLACLAACAPRPDDGRASVTDAGDAGVRAHTELNCIECHAAEYKGARHHQSERPTTCAVCHAQTRWHPTHVDHPWPLDGAHEKAKCFSCHEGEPAHYRDTPTECVRCHQKDYDKAPNHAGRFPTTCQTCHTTTAWKPTLPHEWHAEPHPAPSTTPAPPPSAAPSAAASSAKAPPKPKTPPKKPPKKPTPPPNPDDWPNVITGGSGRR